MKIYICEDCGSGNVTERCRLEVADDVAPPNTCPYQYGEIWRRTAGECEWVEWGPEKDLDQGTADL